MEVACLVDANGIQPTKVGTLPSHLAALMQTNINVQTLLTEAILTENRDRVYHAAMMDRILLPCWALMKYMLLLTT
ncbi:alpha-galactosidase [Escherichia coli]|uniref:Alpha-galactosidase n=1 Tax=Escherichia coli TaxID=562 RepID=A0A376RRU3_ECOLX|nr:alpha-galactosidase [Escherichia coli]